MSDSDDDLLNNDYLGRAVKSSSSTATSHGVTNSGMYSLEALLARRETIQRDAEVAMRLRRVGDDEASTAATTAATTTATTTNDANNVDDLDTALAAIRASHAQQQEQQSRQRSQQRLMTPNRVCALKSFSASEPPTVSACGDFVNVDAPGSSDKLVRLRCTSLALPSAMKTAALISSGALAYTLPNGLEQCSPALLNALLLCVVLERVDVLLAMRASELACRIVANDMCSDWRPSVTDVLSMFQLVGATAVAPGGAPLRVEECRVLDEEREGDSSADAAGNVLPVENVRLLCDCVSQLAGRPQFYDAAGGESPLLIVRVLLTLLADARIARVLESVMVALAALFDGCVGAGLTDALALEVAGCCGDPSTLYAVIRHLPRGSANARLATARAAALALHSLAGGPVRDVEACLRAADEAVRAKGAASTSGSLVRFAIAQFERCAAVPLHAQQGETDQFVAEVNWLMTCALLTDICVSCDVNRLHGSLKSLERLGVLLQQRNSALHEDRFSPLLSLAKTQLGALRAKVTMLAGVVVQTPDRTIADMMMMMKRKPPPTTTTTAAANQSQSNGGDSQRDDTQTDDYDDDDDDDNDDNNKHA